LFLPTFKITVRGVSQVFFPNCVLFFLPSFWAIDCGVPDVSPGSYPLSPQSQSSCSSDMPSLFTLPALVSLVVFPFLSYPQREGEPPCFISLNLSVPPFFPLFSLPPRFLVCFFRSPLPHWGTLKFFFSARFAFGTFLPL